MKKIGFIALSGVRAHNAELTKLGLTLPGFVDRNKIIALLPSLGLLTLAGLTPKKFDVKYHEIADLIKNWDSYKDQSQRFIDGLKSGFSDMGNGIKNVFLDIGVTVNNA